MFNMNKNSVMRCLKYYTLSSPEVLPSTHIIFCVYLLYIHIMTAERLAISLSFDQVIWITANHLFTPLNVTLSHIPKGFS